MMRTVRDNRSTVYMRGVHESSSIKGTDKVKIIAEEGKCW